MTKECIKKQRRLFIACVFSSLTLHSLMLYLFQIQGIWNTPSHHSDHGAICWEKEERQAILKETFQNFSSKERGASQTPKKMHLPQKIEESPKLLGMNDSLESLSPSIPPAPFHPSDLLTYNRSDALSLKAPTPSLHPFLASAPLANYEGEPLLEKTPLAPPSKQSLPLLLTSAPPACNIAAGTFAANENNPLIQMPLLSEETVQQRASLAIPAPPLPSFPTLGELDTGAYSNEFDLEVVCSPKEDGEGYLFAATLIPHPHLTLPKLKQHYTFLIDRSNSIQRERLLATKSAVLRSLNQLDPEDTFNIVIFDSKVEKAFPQNRPYTPSSVEEAKRFLDKIQLGSFFAPADLYNPLFLTLPYPENVNEVYTTVLLTDGEALAKKSGMRSILHTWTRQNNGKTALYTIGMGCDPNIAALDAASALNRGHFSSSPTKRGIKRKLLRLVKNIKTPIAKNLSAKAISTRSSASIELFPEAHNIPHLYLNQPIVILGSCDNLDDFVLFVQGRSKDRWFNIKKTVSFINAKKGGRSLRKEWALQQAYLCYENYITDDNPLHLAKAKDLLEPFGLQVAFE